jgi:uncharacterized protein DUF3309
MARATILPAELRLKATRLSSRDVGLVPGTLRAVVALMETLVVIVTLLVAAVVLMPGWLYAARWGYVPASACGILAFAMAALVLIGRL